MLFRSMTEKDMESIAEIMDIILTNPNKIDEVNELVSNLCDKFPLYR